MKKEEILQNISNYLDTLEIRDGTEGVVYMNMVYLQFHRNAWDELIKKYNLKEGDEITEELREEIHTIIGKKLSDFYDKNKENMPWNN